jgi:hypothetical protein
MRNLIYLLTALSVMGLAFWAYHENYQTKAATSELARLQSQIASLREGLAVLNAEWAYLNRPDRLAELAMLNFARLELFPMTGAQFGEVMQVAFPAPEPAPAAALNPVDAIGHAEGRP